MSLYVLALRSRVQGPPSLPLDGVLAFGRVVASYGEPPRRAVVEADPADLESFASSRPWLLAEPFSEDSSHMSGPSTIGVSSGSEALP